MLGWNHPLNQEHTHEIPPVLVLVLVLFVIADDFFRKIVKNVFVIRNLKETHHGVVPSLSEKVDDVSLTPSSAER